MQEPAIFENHGQTIFGMVHIPEAPHRPPFPALVMLHGFTGHKIEPHQLLVKAARRFAAEGILTLRFDFRGCGESEGDFEDVTIEGECSDALKAIEFARGRGDVRSDRVGLLGNSFGGSIAASVAGLPGSNLKCLILWAAVADPPRAFAAKATPGMIQQRGQRVINDYHGNALSQRLIDELVNFKPLDKVRSYPGPVAIFHGDEDKSVSPEDASLYYKVLEHRGVTELHLIKGAGHTFASLAWERELITMTSRFLRRHLLI
jgi:alpha/beta superfamily hydrolase